MHDWQNDLRAGHASCVVVSILRDIGLMLGPYSLSGLLPQLERQFWNHSLPRLCDVVTEHIAAARQALPSVLTDANIINHLLDEIETSIAYTRQQQSEAKQFLDNYHA